LVSFGGGSNFRQIENISKSIWNLRPGYRLEVCKPQEKFHLQHDTEENVTMVKSSMYSLTEHSMMDYRERKQPMIPKSINEVLEVLEILRVLEQK